MSLKTLLVRFFALRIHRENQKWIKTPLRTQQKVFNYLIASAQHTSFGKDHDFSNIHSYKDFIARVPIRDYEDFIPYIERTKSGESDVLWQGSPIYLAKTSGTTSGIKYIPITKESIPTHIRSARDAILNYIYQTGRTEIVNGKMIFLQGNPILSKHNGIMIGRLSGIVAHHVPKYLQKSRMPSWRVNCIEDWESKVEAIVKETLNKDMTVIGGIPSWVQMYFEQLIKTSGKSSLKELFPNFGLFIFGGINYAPYKCKLESLIGIPVDSIELYPASEGFFAYQDDQNQQGMLLLLNSGIFYEFVQIEDLHKKTPKRLTLKDVKLGQNYLMLISTTAGLWAYNLGDIIAFVSINPHRVIVTGRSKHFISAFGEHVIASEVEYAITKVSEKTKSIVNEFTVAPMVNPAKGELPYHQWFIEFEKKPNDLTEFANILDQMMQQQNIYYKDLIAGKILQTLKIKEVSKNGFLKFMKSKGKLGGQNKIQKLSNDRSLVDTPEFINVLKKQSS